MDGLRDAVGGHKLVFQVFLIYPSLHPVGVGQFDPDAVVYIGGIFADFGHHHMIALIQHVGAVLQG